MAFIRTGSRLAIKNVMVLGGGTMGAGIAQVSAATGKFKVTLVDLNQDVLDKSKQNIEATMRRMLSRQLKDDPAAQYMTYTDRLVNNTMANISFSTDGPGTVAGSDLLIEAIVENIDVKRKVFAEMDAVAGPGTIFASNTSSLQIGAMAEATKRGERFGGLHFFSPVPLMQLVEVIKGPQTSDAVFDEMVDFVKDIKKTPVRCKDTDGFFVNRLLVPLLMESIRLVERGDGEVADVDTAMKLGAGHPMGPFTLADNVGLDVIKFIIDGWHKKHPDNPLFEPSPWLDRLVAEGKLGVKTGEGFLVHKKK